MTLNVVELDLPNLNDIPDMLELLAESIRAGDCGEVRSLALAFEGPVGIEQRLFGHLDVLSGIGLHHAAATILTNMMVEEP